MLLVYFAVRLRLMGFGNKVDFGCFRLVWILLCALDLYLVWDFGIGGFRFRYSGLALLILIVLIACWFCFVFGALL